MPRLPLICAMLLLAAQAAYSEEIRHWEDETGRFRVRAELLEVSGGQVKLRREDNGETISLSLAQLRAEDRAYVQARTAPEDGGKQIIRERGGPRRWALLVGVNDYLNARDLRFAVADMKALRDQLVAAGFPEKQVFLLEDGGQGAADRPFRANVENLLNLLLGSLTEDGSRVVAPGVVGKSDSVVVAFSGHGVHLGEQSYFCPTDADLDRPASLIPLEGIYRRLAASEAAVRLLLVDACRNDPRPEGRKDFKATEETEGFAASLDAPPRGILVLSSCAPGQVSMEDEEFGHGAFMHYVLEGLAGAADTEKGDRNQRVSLLELYRYAEERTKFRVLEKHRLAQTPRLRGEIQGDWEFADLGAAAALEEARAEIELARTQLARLVRLEELRAVTREEVERGRAALAEAQLRLAELEGNSEAIVKELREILMQRQRTLDVLVPLRDKGLVTEAEIERARMALAETRLRLAELEGDREAAIAELQAIVNYEQRNFERVETLRERGAATRDEVDRARQKLEEVKRRLALETESGAPQP